MLSNFYELWLWNQDLGALFSGLCHLSKNLFFLPCLWNFAGRRWSLIQCLSELCHIFRLLALNGKAHLAPTCFASQCKIRLIQYHEQFQFEFLFRSWLHQFVRSTKWSSSLLDIYSESRFWQILSEKKITKRQTPLYYFGSILLLTSEVWRQF